MSVGFPAPPPAQTFGLEFARKFGIEDAPAIVTRSLPHGQFAATEIRVDQPTGLLPEPIPPEDAYLLCLVLRDQHEFSYWEEGREHGRYVHAAGVTTISDLRRRPAGRLDIAVHALAMYLPRATMNGLADASSLPRVETLRFDGGVGVQDQVIRGLGLSLLPALHEPDRVNRLFTDHVAMALAAHTAAVYGAQQVLRPVRGGLAPWQERRAKEMILADLSGLTSLADLAAACGLSADHFARSFRRSTGLAPHAWLLSARVERAMMMLRRLDQPMATIATACGFANPSHFARVFTRHTGVNPSVWRRLERH